MYSNSKEKYSQNKRKNKQKTIQYSFDEIIFQPELFLQILENSFNNQKNFINYIKTKKVFQIKNQFNQQNNYSISSL